MKVLTPSLAGVLVLMLLGGCDTRTGDGGAPVSSRLDVREILGGEADPGFQRARRPRLFRFPEDHGPHPAFRTEWWYVTGNLLGPEGEPFGFQLTFFRNALAPPDSGSTGSAWRTRQVYMAHFALTDGKRADFHAFERFSRGALGLAGAQAVPFRVWLEDWALRGTGDGMFPLLLRTSEGGVGLELTLVPEKPLILQGDQGFSRKGSEAGNASFYYSFTRLQASGSLTLGGSAVPVRGSAWLDREWSTSALSADQEGWDWFALQLDDGFDLMVYRIRDRSGRPDPFSDAVLVDPEGGTRRIAPEEIELQVLDTWSSPEDETSYPGRWRIGVPAMDTWLEVTPLVRDQEFRGTFRYWEGAVRVEGTREGKPVVGRGYVEMTGYAPTEGPGGAGTLRGGRTGGVRSALFSPIRRSLSPASPPGPSSPPG
jgi:predicted secreted hydrolase